MLQASVFGVSILYSDIRFTQYYKWGVLLPLTSNGEASWFFNLIHADIPVFGIISSIGIRSIINSTLACGVFLVIVVVDQAASLSSAFNFFSW